MEVILAWSNSIHGRTVTRFIQSLTGYRITYDHGIPLQTSGIYVSLLQIAIIPLTFVTPIVATKMKSQVPLTLLTSILFTIGVLCFIFVDYKFVLVGIILIGVASGLAFGLANIICSKKKVVKRLLNYQVWRNQLAIYLQQSVLSYSEFFTIGRINGHFHCVLLIVSLLICIRYKAGSQTTIEQTKVK